MSSADAGGGGLSLPCLRQRSCSPSRRVRTVTSFTYVRRHPAPTPRRPEGQEELQWHGKLYETGLGLLEASCQTARKSPSRSPEPVSPSNLTAARGQCRQKSLPSGVAMRRGGPAPPQLLRLLLLQLASGLPLLRIDPRPCPQSRLRWPHGLACRRIILRGTTPSEVNVPRPRVSGTLSGAD